MTPEQLQVLDSNKREMFDAMRAYHESERGHKTDAMTVLAALFATVGAVFGALVLSEKGVPYAGVLAALTAVAATFGVLIIVAKTNAKIGKDHETYAKFGAEYVRTCDAMGFYGTGLVAPEASPIKSDRAIGQGEGYKSTQAIIESIGWTVVILSWLAFAFVALAVCPRTGMCTSATTTVVKPGDCKG